jgi:hypothetical protein
VLPECHSPLIPAAPLVPLVDLLGFPLPGLRIGNPRREDRVLQVVISKWPRVWLRSCGFELELRVC